MKTIEFKKLYEAPELMQVRLDNDISLVLASGDTPPAPPWGGGLSDSHFESMNSFKEPIA